MNDGSAEPSACKSSPWKMAQSSIVAASNPVITYADVVIGMRQSDWEPDQLKDPLQSEAVVKIKTPCTYKVCSITVLSFL
jgi:hypothetical protein